MSTSSKDDSISIITVEWKRPVDFFLYRSTINRLNKSLDGYELQHICVLNETSLLSRILVPRYFKHVLNNKENLGDAIALYQALRLVKTEYVLLLEADWRLTGEPKDIKDLLKLYIELLDLNILDVVRLRSIRNPGYPYWSLKNYLEKGEINSTHYLNIVADKTYNHQKNNAGIINSLDFKGERVFYSSSKYANYTNNPFLMKASKLSELLESIHPLREISLEKQINQAWESNSLLVGQGTGVFKHAPITLSGSLVPKPYKASIKTNYLTNLLLKQ